MKNIQNLIEENINKERVCSVHGICTRGFHFPASNKVSDFGIKKLNEKKQ